MRKTLKDLKLNDPLWAIVDNQVVLSTTKVEYLILSGSMIKTASYQAGYCRSSETKYNNFYINKEDAEEASVDLLEKNIISIKTEIRRLEISLVLKEKVLEDLRTKFSIN